MKTLYFLLCSCLFSVALQAQECSEDFKQIDGLWSKLTLENAINDPESLSSDFDALKGSLTSSLGGLSLKGNAPKFLASSGKAKKGTIKNGKKKTYVTYMAPRETMEINLVGTNDLSGLEVVICAHAKSSMAKNLEVYTFTNAENSKSFLLENVKGQVLSVSLKHSGKKAQFTISAK